MLIHRLEIEHFRGISHLTVDLHHGLTCLVGAGDSTKSTILDGIEYLLSPRWSIQFDDTDFFNLDTTTSIRIAATIGELQDAVVSDSSFGLLLRGWSPSGILHDEPQDDDSLVLTVELRVDGSLEPSWRVVNDRDPEGKRISARDREKLGCVRLGAYVNRHFSWARGSVLSRITGEPDRLSSILASAGRAARDAVTEASGDGLRRLQDAARTVHRVGSDVGIAPRDKYQPLLDVDSVSIGTGAISLHDGQVPVRRAGLGTRRLLALAIQRELGSAAGVILVDEIEHGLEPHRIRRLLSVLQTETSAGEKPQIVVTTHSPIVVEEVRADQLCVVRSRTGLTEVLYVDESLQPAVRRNPAALLARKALVCEGKTELGFVRCLDSWWSRSGPSFAYSGVALVDGGGSEAASTAQSFRSLGYPVALVADSDRELSPSAESLERAGVTLLLWGGGVAIEERVLLDLPWVGVEAVVELACDIVGESNAVHAIAQRLGVAVDVLGPNVSEWRHLEVGEIQVRRAIAAAAMKHNRGWFKRVDRAGEFASTVIDHYTAILGSALVESIQAVASWAHDI